LSASIFERGVISSSAVRVPKRSDRSTRVAVARSSEPARAEVRTSETSSCGERAERNSSAGSIPTRRRIQLAVPLVILIRGVVATENSSCGPDTTRAVASGLATARYWATSSPNTIDTEVAINSASASAMPSANSAVSDSALKVGSKSWASRGSAR
jgi:hypothetical protein